jgi:hypothetical protein
VNFVNFRSSQIEIFEREIAFTLAMVSSISDYGYCQIALKTVLLILKFVENNARRRKSSDESWDVVSGGGKEGLQTVVHE